MEAKLGLSVAKNVKTNDTFSYSIPPNDDYTSSVLIKLMTTNNHKWAHVTVEKNITGMIGNTSLSRMIEHVISHYPKEIESLFGLNFMNGKGIHLKRVHMNNDSLYNSEYYDW